MDKENEPPDANDTLDTGNAPVSSMPKDANDLPKQIEMFASDLAKSDGGQKGNPLYGGVIIRAKDFRKTFGIPNSTRADWENPKSPRFDPTFPKKIVMGYRSVGYFLHQVLSWLASRQRK